MRHLLIATLIGLGVGQFGAAWAQSRLSEKEIQAWDSVQEELAACIGYFNVAKTCAPEGATTDELKRMDRIIDHMDTLAFAVGSRIGMTQDAMLSRLKMAIADQAKLMQGKCINFASLMTRYMDRCKLLGESPEAVFLEYMKK